MEFAKGPNKRPSGARITGRGASGPHNEKPLLAVFKFRKRISHGRCEDLGHDSPKAHVLGFDE